MGLIDDSIPTFLLNWQLKTIDKGLVLIGRNVIASKLWEISNLFNLELFQSNLNIEKPLLTYRHLLL